MSDPAHSVGHHELTVHLTFSEPLPEDTARAALGVLPGMQAELYRPHPSPTGHDPVPVDPRVPSARLTGPAPDPALLRAALEGWLGGVARYAEVGLRGVARDGDGRPEWMPWRRTQVLPKDASAEVALEEGVRYVLE